MITKIPASMPEQRNATEGVARSPRSPLRPGPPVKKSIPKHHPASEVKR